MHEDSKNNGASLNQKADQLLPYFKFALEKLPDAEWVNNLLKKATAFAIKRTLTRDTLTGELSIRCMDQDKRVFSREDLQKVNDKLLPALATMMRENPDIVSLKSGQSMVWDMKWDEDMDGAVRQQDGQKDLRHMLGHVTVLRTKNESFQVMDFTDVKNPRDLMSAKDSDYWAEQETPASLLRAAVRAHEKGPTGYANRNLYIARMFCPEPIGNGPGPHSIPVAITVRADEVLAPQVPTVAVNHSVIQSK